MSGSLGDVRIDSDGREGAEEAPSAPAAEPAAPAPGAGGGGAAPDAYPAQPSPDGRPVSGAGDAVHGEGAEGTAAEASEAGDASVEGRSGAGRSAGVEPGTRPAWDDGLIARRAGGAPPGRNRDAERRQALRRAFAEGAPEFVRGLDLTRGASSAEGEPVSAEGGAAAPAARQSDLRTAVGTGALAPVPDVAPLRPTPAEAPDGGPGGVAAGGFAPAAPSAVPDTGVPVVGPEAAPAVGPTADLTEELPGGPPVSAAEALLVPESAPLSEAVVAPAPVAPAEPWVPSAAPRRIVPAGAGGEQGLGKRLVALRELVGLSRTRVEERTLAEAVRVLDEAAARGRLSRAHTTVALAGPTGCGKSTLFNALAGAQLSEAGVRRPTTAAPVACVWETAERNGGAEGLLERLGVPPRSRRRAHLKDDSSRSLGGLVLLDLPDHDSLADSHRAQVDRLLQLVDAVVWVVDPEKYADAVLHERYLKPLAGHAEVTYVVLNQTDRLPAEVTGELLDDLRRLLDEDGMALGEYGDPGAQVLSLSALTGDGLGELREVLQELVGHRQAAARRLAADVDRVVEELRPVCVGTGRERPEGLSTPVRETFEERLGVAIGAAAAGRTAERVWLRRADLACGTPWSGLARRQVRKAAARRGEQPGGPARPERPTQPAGGATDRGSERDPVARTGRPVVEQAVRGLADDATRGLPADWARSVRAAAQAGGDGLPAALDRALAGARTPVRPERPGWWTAAAVGQAVLLVLQVIGVCWLVGGLVAGGMGGERWLPVALLVVGALGSPLLAWGCRTAARGPARAHGLEQELRLRRLAAECGRARVLEPVAAELLRYSEVRDQYVCASGGPPQP